MAINRFKYSDTIMQFKNTVASNISNVSFFNNAASRSFDNSIMNGLQAASAFSMAVQFANTGARDSSYLMLDMKNQVHNSRNYADHFATNASGLLITIGEKETIKTRVLESTTKKESNSSKKGQQSQEKVVQETESTTVTETRQDYVEYESTCSSNTSVNSEQTMSNNMSDKNLKGNQGNIKSNNNNVLTDPKIINVPVSSNILKPSGANGGFIPPDNPLPVSPLPQPATITPLDTFNPANNNDLSLNNDRLNKSLSMVKKLDSEIKSRREEIEKQEEEIQLQEEEAYKSIKALEQFSSGAALEFQSMAENALAMQGISSKAYYDNLDNMKEVKNTDRKNKTNNKNLKSNKTSYPEVSLSLA